MKTKMTKIELTIGLNTSKRILTINKNAKPAKTYHEAVDILKQFLTAKSINCFTTIPCTGVWNGELEDSIRVEIWTFENFDWKCVEQLVDLMQQDCIMAIWNNGQPEFVE